MQMHQIASLFVGAALASSASAATITLTVSGSTSLNKTFEKTALDMCSTSSPSNTYSTSGGAKPAVRYECIAKAGLGIPGVATGDTLIINKEQGTSINGVTPVNNSTVVTVATTADTGGTAGPCSASTIDPVVPLRTHYTGCGSTTAIPTAGLSDVEPKLLTTVPNYINLSTKCFAAQVFGMAVSDNIYRQLQLVQRTDLGLTSTNVADLALEDPFFAPAKAPSLNAPFVRGTFSGGANDWTAVDPGLTPDIGRSGFTHPNQFVWDDAQANTTAVKICSRAPGSGARAAFEATVMKKPCCTTPTFGGALNLSGFLTDDTPLNDSNGAFLGETDVYTVVENRTAEAVDTCLTQAYYQGEMAIGILSTERQSGDTGSMTFGSDDNDGVQDKWHYVKIGLAYPSMDNFLKGYYDFYWAEASFNRRKTPGYTSTEINMMNYLEKEMGNPTTIVRIPLPGIAGLTTLGYPFDYGMTPVARGSRNCNVCQEGVQIY